MGIQNPPCEKGHDVIARKRRAGHRAWKVDKQKTMLLPLGKQSPLWRTSLYHSDQGWIKVRSVVGSEMVKR